MNIYNASSNSFTFTALWPDGSSQTISLISNTGVTVPGVQIGGSNTMDSINQLWQGVNSDPVGFQIHATFTPFTYFWSGFWFGVPMVIVWLAVWAVLRGLHLANPRIPRIED